MQALAALGQAVVEQALNTPPTTTTVDVGKMWLIGTTPTGIWTGRANQLALCTSANVWFYFIPGTNAWLIWDKNATQMKRWNGTAWIVFTSTSGSTSKGHIDGMRPSYVGAASISVSSGECYVEGQAGVVAYAAAVTKSSLTLSASTWYHVYAYLNGSTPDIEVVITAPAAPYSGSARSKTGDTSRRYLFSFKTNASSQILPFQYDTLGTFWYSVQPSTNGLRPISNGKATTRTSISLSAGLPVTATFAVLQVVNSDTTVFVNLGNPSQPSGGVIGIAPGGPNSGQVVVFPSDTNQAIDYYYAVAPANGVYVDIYGYAIAR
ncbi:DUF2793 domain-containing protein [Lysobacter yananisis]|uniref:DUF2793 domain-containing protein n=1 Tax=Lysobacter yananisis TaxID=1003114 RepID=UPI00300AF348